MIKSFTSTLKTERIRFLSSSAGPRFFTNSEYRPVDI